MTPQPDLAGLLTQLDADWAPAACCATRPWRRMTTFKVGGPADALIETRISDEIVAAVRAAAAHHVPVTVLGGGSNVLVARRRHPRPRAAAARRAHRS